jgi:hypothetical protein|tara:strand:- start:3707 stop:4102 length:396 start_codon:yes stop_codon:yes gene_type:complete
MMGKKLDLNDIARFENAIAKKYGKEAIENPRKYWNDEKEESYKKQIREMAEKEYVAEERDEKVEQDGFLVSKKLLNRETTKRVCPVCKAYSFKIRDDVFMNKFDCCYNCYIKWIEGGREERWLSGWRPNKT